MHGGRLALGESSWTTLSSSAYITSHEVSIVRECWVSEYLITIQDHGNHICASGDQVRSYTGTYIDTTSLLSFSGFLIGYEGADQEWICLLSLCFRMSYPD
jgi:hypothetical protein